VCKIHIYYNWDSKSKLSDLLILIFYMIYRGMVHALPL
jgi:hypothetical protein